jgi:glycosyltransferase involved in cell wall biosynthesis
LTVIAGDWLLLFKHYKGWYNTISNAMKELMPSKERFAGTIYNAIDVASYPFNGGTREDYLLFLSRVSLEKGPHLAIQVAQRLEMPLILAGNVHPVDEEYFCTQVLPHVDGSLIQYVGEADYSSKRQLLSRACCLLAPITWPEPFGLFMVEAMACGTPVVVFNRGSAPEVVRHGVTGFVVDTLEEMVEAASQVKRLDPRACRQHVEHYFTDRCIFSLTFGRAIIWA